MLIEEQAYRWHWSRWWKSPARHAGARGFSLSLSRRAHKAKFLEISQVISHHVMKHDIIKAWGALTDSVDGSHYSTFLRGCSQKDSKQNIDSLARGKDEHCNLG
jgi:hypothetical protein